jgi:hypothetical protein
MSANFRLGSLGERRVCIDTAPTFHLADWFEGPER